jgi:Protein of unknown function (DUF2804)
MIDEKRRFSLNFGRGLGNQTFASENAIIINEKIHKLGQIDISYLTRSRSHYSLTLTHSHYSLTLNLTPLSHSPHSHLLTLYSLTLNLHLSPLSLSLSHPSHSKYSLTLPTFDENSLMNPWVITSNNGMRLIFAPFVDFQTESSKTFLLLSTRAQRVFGTFVGSMNLAETGEEINLQDVNGFAEVFYSYW